ncbi:protein tyrosine phosphatase family protein [Sulfuriferula nivalis]|uniref:DSP-PTPase phosphatase fused to NAD+ Kinase domain-containing protein n=1 Tax=Sulfuriferula nivalis TaxID=2675298 RepID=A0A809RPA9_9PROT|nr:protein tyrosine phosphatase family protein [Sulfuriferula nivalis]BBP00661.1 hypothetical protein SFSGTM_13690 [Sulfuriferula nivalis]
MIDPALSGIYKIRAIDESLCTSGQPTVAQLQEIAAAGFKAVINLALHDDPRYSLPDEAGTVRSLGMGYVHIPVQFSAPTKNDLAEFFAAMKAHEGQEVWVHCAANIRVSVFLGLYRIIEQRWERDVAFAQLSEVWEPDQVWSAFIESALESPNG